MKKGIAFLLAACFGIGAGLISASAYEIMQVTDETMLPSYQQGSHVLVDHFLRKEKIFDRGDVVLFANSMYTETGEGDIMMKRIIALPGEWISIIDGRVYVDDKPLDESGYVAAAGRSGNLPKRYVPQGSYFVLGDNRISSTDSRDETVGMIKEEDILGKVIRQW